jgi:nitrile hydratase accessory protein
MIRPGLRAHAGTPSFVEPWHAQAFAAVVTFNQAGRFTWAEWVEIFSAEIAGEPQCDGEENEAAYYRQWLAAFERLLADRGLVLAEEITTADDWRQSYLRTPHGRPVCLGRDPARHPTPVRNSRRSSSGIAVSCGIASV